MAVTDDQLVELNQIAFAIGQDRKLDADTDEGIVLAAVCGAASDKGMRTQDEFEAEITPDDLPAPEDRREIMRVFKLGREGPAIRMVTGFIG